MLSHSRSVFRTTFSLMAVSAAAAVLAQPVAVGDVTGKEYTDLLDVNAAGALTPTQNLHWYGNGTVADSYRYLETGEVDALAAPGDAYFDDLLNNTAALIFSVNGDHGGPLRYELPTGVNGIWATAAEINSRGVNDLDALELWGPDDQNDAEYFSLFGDPGGFAIYDRNGGAPVGLVTTGEIASAIGLAGAQVDLDALMVFSDRIVFSIRAFGPYDGGELFVYTLGGGAGPATYLVHGGHVWDTAFDVGATFGCPTDEIDAIEAVPVVPEPGTIAALALGAGALLRRRARKA